ncbi:hypothetical protein P692DRAFT_20835417 [Suillus brevipes Sb2]|nr:hypothetical protein P692DRAFT_20835417 [Suillus brevipes Sb2]
MRWMSRPTSEQNTHLQIRSPVHTTNVCVGPPSDKSVQSIGDIRRHSFYLLGYASNPDFTKDVNLNHYRTLVVGLVWVTTIVPYLPTISPPPPTFHTMHRPHRLIYEPLLRLRRVCSQLHPSSLTASTYRSVKSFSNFTIVENMQSNGSSKGSSKASGRSVRSFLSVGPQQKEECR